MKLGDVKPAYVYRLAPSDNSTGEFDRAGVFAATDDPLEFHVERPERGNTVRRVWFRFIEGPAELAGLRRQREPRRGLSIHYEVCPLRDWPGKAQAMAAEINAVVAEMEDIGTVQAGRVAALVDACRRLGIPGVSEHTSWVIRLAGHGYADQVVEALVLRAASRP